MLRWFGGNIDSSLITNIQVDNNDELDITSQITLNKNNILKGIGSITAISPIDVLIGQDATQKRWC